MVPVLVLLTFAACLVFDRLVVRKGYLDERSGWPAKLAWGSPSCPCQTVPDGVYLQPTYTWSRIGASGRVYLGVHPALLALVGPQGELELLAEGDRVEKGAALARLGRAERRLTVRSPIAGRVAKVNREATRGAAWWGEVAAGRTPWLYELRAETVAEETPHWLTGRAALDWTRRRYEELRAFLLDAAPAARLGAVMADGGDVSVGILGSMDQSVWTTLEERFLAPPVGGAERSDDRSPQEFAR